MNTPEGFSTDWDNRGWRWWCHKCGVARRRGVVPSTCQAEMIQHAFHCRHPKTWIAITGDYLRIALRSSVRR